MKTISTLLLLTLTALFGFSQSDQEPSSEISPSKKEELISAIEEAIEAEYDYIYGFSEEKPNHVLVSFDQPLDFEGFRSKKKTSSQNGVILKSYIYSLGDITVISQEKNSAIVKAEEEYEKLWEDSGQTIENHGSRYHIFNLHFTGQIWEVTKDTVYQPSSQKFFESSNHSESHALPEATIPSFKDYYQNLQSLKGATYNRDSAVSYAITWAKRRNEDVYRTEEGNDCTNFVSQCLTAGGWEHTSGGFDAPMAWWSDKPERTKAWINAESFFNFAISSGRVLYWPWSSHLSRGDIVSFDWGGNSSINHQMIVTKKTESETYLGGHDIDYRYEPLSEILARNESAKPYYLKVIKSN